ncbi:MAG: hypothetical protein L0323_16360 [Planctomycetes bacterium]|nr:hypothetical protein [Planctomycetota bacterium]
MRGVFCNSATIAFLVSTSSATEPDSLRGSPVERESRPSRSSWDWSRPSECAVAWQEDFNLELRAQVLVIVTKYPGLDDEGIALKLGVTPIEASRILLQMEEDGLLTGR